MTDKRIGFIQLIAVIGFILFSFFISYSLKQDNKDEIIHKNTEIILSVETESISPQSYQIKFNSTGIIAPRAKVNITPQISGKVISIHDNFFNGGGFTSKDILFKIDPKDFELEVQRLKALLASATTAMQLEQAESDAAVKEWKQLRGKKDVPDLVARKPQLSEAKANIAAAQAQLENAQLDLDRTNFRLPFNGRVISSEISNGQYINAGQSYGTVFDTQNIEITSSLNSKQLQWLVTGDTDNVKISIKKSDAIQNYQGFLKRSAANLSATTRFATVNFGINGNVENILPGSFAKLILTGPKLENITLIPLSSYQNDGMVWMVNNDNTLSSILPKIIHINDTHIVVQNIHKTSKIVVSKLSGVVENMDVTIINKDTQK